MDLLVPLLKQLKVYVDCQMNVLKQCKLLLGLIKLILMLFLFIPDINEKIVMIMCIFELVF